MSSVPAHHPLRVLAIVTEGDAGWRDALAGLTASAWGPFVVERCADRESAAARLAQSPVDAVIAGVAAGGWPGLSQTTLNVAVLLVADEMPVPDAVAELLGHGVQDVLPAPVDVDTVARSLRLAIERKRIEREARKAYATDLATGLPNHAQLVEHMSHLLALREREPAPMALLVLRLEGLGTTATRLGPESANVLRRKLAVRLRAGVRASDVVASLGTDGFAVLLSAMEEPSHAHRVAHKLAEALHQPMKVAGHPVGVAVGVGVALYPADGKEADALLRKAGAVAAISPAVGREGLSRHGGAAANDEAAED